MPTARAPKIFISYSRDDASYARQLVDALTSEGVDIWFDREQIAAGEPIRAKLARALRDSDVIISLVSPNSLDNPNLLFELGAAVGMGKRIIPIVSSTTAISRLPAPFRTRRYLQRRPAKQMAKALAEEIEGELPLNRPREPRSPARAKAAR